MEFPVDCKTPEERTAYCYRAQELLQLRHNKEWEDGGYKTAVATIKAKYEADIKSLPVDEVAARLEKRDDDIRVAMAPFRKWQRDWDEERKEEEVTTALLASRAELKSSTKWDSDIDLEVI